MAVPSSPPPNCSGAAYCGVRAPPQSLGQGGGAAIAVVQQPGDAEVQQLHAALAVDQDVRGLQVPVQHQAVVRVGHGIQHVAEQPQRGRHAHCQPLHVAVDGFAVHMLQHQVGLPPVGSHTGIEQAGDVGMVQLGQDGAFAREALAVARAQQPAAQELDGHTGLVAAIAAVGAPHAAHAAFAQQGVQRVGAEAVAGPGGHAGHGRQGRQRGAGHEAPWGQVLFLRQQLGQFVGQRRVGLAPDVQPRGAGFGGQVQQFVEPGIQLGPAFGCHRSDSASSSLALCQSRCTVRSVRSSAWAISASDRPPK